MTVARLGPAVVTLSTSEGKDYVVCLGGVDAEGTALKTCEMMDTVTKKWSLLPEMPEARAAPGAVAWQGGVIVYGECIAPKSEGPRSSPLARRWLWDRWRPAGYGHAPREGG